MSNEPTDLVCDLCGDIDEIEVMYCGECSRYVCDLCWPCCVDGEMFE